MAIITLTTDFGQGDYSVSALKGALYSCLPKVCLIDISHQIIPYNITQTAYILKNTYIYFPKGTLHIIGVDAERTHWQRHILVQYDGHYFLGADNGILSIICKDESILEIVEIDKQKEACSFPSIKVFPEVAQQLFSGKTLSQIGKPTAQQLKQTLFFTPSVSEDRITGEIIYIDSFGNAISSITKDMFTSVCNGRDFEVYVAGQCFKTIHNSYNAIADTYKDPDGRAMLLFNYANYLELAIYKSNMITIGGASSLLGVNYKDSISIVFKS